MTRRAVLVITVLAVSLLFGCYSFNPRGQSDLATIAIEPFDNRTPELTLTERLTQLVTDAFIADGSIKVVPSEAAEALLFGTLLRYDRLPQRFDENDQVEQYKVVMVFEVILKGADAETELWKETMTQEGIYDALSESEEIGQTEATRRLVESIINKTTKSW